MRVAHINLSAELRGGEFQTLALIRALSGTVDQRLIARRGSPLLERAANLRGCQIYPVANSLVAAARATQGCDLLHVHDGRSTKVGALAGFWGKPFVVTRRIQKPPSDRALTRYCYSRASTIACVSDAVARTMRDYLGSSTNIETVYDGVSPIGQPARSRTRKGPFVVGCVGELDNAVKGQSTLFAAARLLKSNPDIVFWIVGSGKDQARMRAWAADLKNVRFAGWVSDVGSCYKEMDLLVHPARQEGLGSAILEAMALGIPVVGSRVGGIPEVIRPGYNGELFDIDDVDALVAAIGAYSARPALLAQSSVGALQTARQFSTEVMAQRYLRRYLEVVARQDNVAAHAKPSG